MPNRRNAIKRLRADKKRHLRNLRVKIALKKELKKFQALISNKKIEEAKKVLQKVYSLLDKAAKKKIIHKNLALRKKSRLSKSLNRIT